MKRKGASQQGASSQAAKSRKTADEDNEKQPLRTAESAADDDSDEKQPLCGCLCGKDLGVIGTDAASLEETAALRGGRDVWECDSCGTTSDRRYGCVQKNGSCDLDVCGKCRDAGHCSSILSTARTKIEDIKQKAKESARYNKDLVQATQRKNKELQSKLAEAEKELIALREEVSELKAVRKLDMDEPEPEWGTGNLEPKEEEEGGSENEDLALVVSTPKPEALAAPVNRPPPAEPVHNKPESPQSQAPSPTTWKIVAGVTLTDGLKSKAMCWGSESKTETVCGPVTDCKVKCNHCGKQLQPKVHNIKGHWKNHHSPEAEKGKAARPKTGATTPSAVSTNTSGTHKSPFEAESATELSIQDSITIDTALKCIPFSWYSDTLHRRNLSSELQGEGFGKEKVAARTDTLAEEVRTVVREKVVDRDCVVMIDVAKKNRRSWLGFALACDGATYFHDVVELLDTKSETIRTACEETFANLEDHGVRVFAVCADNANNMLRALKDMQGESMDVDDLDGDDDYEPNDEDEDSCDHIVDLTLDFCARLGFFTFRCSVHTFQLALGDLFKYASFQSIKTAILDLSSRYNEPHAKSDLLARQMAKGVEKKKCFGVSVPTTVRWNSIVDCALSIACLAEYLDFSTVSAGMEQKIVFFLKIAQPLALATDRLQANSAGLGNVRQEIARIDGIFSELKSKHTNAARWRKDLIDFAIAKFEKRKVVHFRSDGLRILEILDPRVLKSFSPAQSEKDKQVVMKYLQKFWEKRGVAKDSCLDHWLDYRSSGVIVFPPGRTLQEYWKSKRDLWPTLATFFLCLTRAAASEAVVERHFKQLGRMLTKKKSRLTEARVRNSLQISLNSKQVFKFLRDPPPSQSPEGREARGRATWEHALGSQVE